MKKLIASLLLISFAASASLASLEDLFPEELLDREGNPVERESLEGKLIGIYFSASWCPPCRAFTPKLVDFRNENAEDFQVVFVSADRSADDQMKYMADYEMEFLTLEHGSPYAQMLTRKFSVRGIPHLAIIDSEGNIVRDNARGEVAQNAERALSDWKASL